MNSPAPRRIIVCADDYGLSPGVNRAILELIERGRINATSVMTVGPAFDRASTAALRDAANTSSCQVGLHVTLTAPFRPLTLHFRHLQSDTFMPLSRLLGASLLRRLDREMLRAEIAAQLAAFQRMFGRPPDYVDGHQHVQSFPQVRDAFLDAVAGAAPAAWIRQCGRSVGASRSSGDLKSVTLDMLSAGLRKRASRGGVAFNPAFAGAYDFTREPDFADLFEKFLEGLPEGGLVMCHPGFVDEMLIALDPLTKQREREYEFLASEALPALLAARNFVLSGQH
jgi:chitin disaccharide deacetylase